MTIFFNMVCSKLIKAALVSVLTCGPGSDTVGPHFTQAYCSVQSALLVFNEGSLQKSMTGRWLCSSLSLMAIFGQCHQHPHPFGYFQMWGLGISQPELFCCYDYFKANSIPVKNGLNLYRGWSVGSMETPAPPSMWEMQVPVSNGYNHCPRHLLSCGETIEF